MILINEKWCIQVDEHNYMPSRYDKPIPRLDKDTGKESITYRAECFCKDLSHALEWIIDKEVSEYSKNADISLGQALQYMSDVKDEIVKLVNEV